MPRAVSDLVKEQDDIPQDSEENQLQDLDYIPRNFYEALTEENSEEDPTYKDSNTVDADWTRARATNVHHHSTFAWRVFLPVPTCCSVAPFQSHILSELPRALADFLESSYSLPQNPKLPDFSPSVSSLFAFPTEFTPASIGASDYSRPFSTSMELQFQSPRGFESSNGEAAKETERPPVLWADVVSGKGVKGGNAVSGDDAVLYGAPWEAACLKRVPNGTRLQMQQKSQLREIKESTASFESEEEVDVGKPPPILLYEVGDYREILHVINKAVRDNTYTLRLGRESDFLQLKTMEDYRHVSQVLASWGIQMSSWPTNEERTTTYVVLGISWRTGANFVLDELVALSVPVRCVYTKTTIKGAPMDIFVVVVWRSSKWKEEDILQIKTLGKIRVRLEVYRYKEPQMCTNCNRFGHSSYYCVANTRCIKCAGPHHSYSCSFEFSPHCCNCHGNHFANNRTCPAYIKAMERKRVTENQGKSSTKVSGTAKKDNSVVSSLSCTNCVSKLEGATPLSGKHSVSTASLLTDENFPALSPIKTTSQKNSFEPSGLHKQQHLISSSTINVPTSRATPENSIEHLISVLDSVISVTAEFQTKMIAIKKWLRQIQSTDPQHYVEEEANKSVT